MTLLIQALQDEQSHIRLQAAELLCWLKDERATDALIQAPQDNEPEVREWSLLSHLQEVPLLLAIASSSRRTVVDLVLSILHLSDTFAVIVTGEQVIQDTLHRKGSF